MEKENIKTTVTNWKTPVFKKNTQILPQHNTIVVLKSDVKELLLPWPDSHFILVDYPSDSDFWILLPTS